MNVLLVIGLIMLLGVVSGKVFQKLNLPQVMGYIIVGILLGESFQGVISWEFLQSFSPFIDLALGVIGFLIGAELNFDRFKKYGKSIYTILLAESLITFFLVALVATLLTGKVYMGLILGALASATAPAATYNVIGEYKARGPLTMTTLSIVALDDGVALIIYGFASAFARTFIAHESFSVITTIGYPLLEIAFSAFIGAVSGFVLHKIILRVRDRERILPITFGTIIFVVGLARFFDVDAIFAAMILGAVVSTLQTSEHQEMFDLIKRFSAPIYVLFFVLVGARLDARIFAKIGVISLAVAYIIARSVGKLSGAYIGGKISKAKETVTKYLGFCLFDQAGVAVGLAIASYNVLSKMGPEAQMAGLLIINIITATTFLLQIIAPPMIKYGVKKADEMYRNVTEEDIIQEYKVRDVMEEDFFLIRENNNLHQIIDIMKKSDGYIFPVIGMDEKFIGVVSLGEIRDTFYEEQMDQLILAEDIYREVDIVVYADQELKDAMDIFKAKNIDYLPVLENNRTKRLVGQLEYKKIKEFISREVILRQQELET